MHIIITGILVSKLRVDRTISTPRVSTYLQQIYSENFNTITFNAKMVEMMY